MFEKLIKDKGVVVADGLEIRESPLGGYGIFYNGEPNDCLLRVPQSSTLTVRHLVEQLKTIWAKDEFYKSLYEQCLATLQPTSESQALIVLLVVYGTALRLGAADDEYVRVLFNEVQYGGLIAQDLEELEELYIGELSTDIAFTSAVAELADYEPLIEWFSEHGLDVLETITKDYPVAVSAVRSRALEIPKAVDDDSEDYVVDVSLVPVLDFVNHSHTPNCVFDVDRKTGDIILKPIRDLVAGEELFIEYDCENNCTEVTEKDLDPNAFPSFGWCRFAVTYGFFPDSPGADFMETYRKKFKESRR